MVDLCFGFRESFQGKVLARKMKRKELTQSGIKHLYSGFSKYGGKASLGPNAVTVSV